LGADQQETIHTAALLHDWLCSWEMVLFSAFCCSGDCVDPGNPSSGTSSGTFDSASSETNTKCTL